MLAGIFTWQASIFTGAVIGCFRAGVKDACPDLGTRYENTVNVMVATTLALLTGGAVVGATKKQEGELKQDEPPKTLPNRTKQQ